MKLELKHLAPYLPYELKMYWENLVGEKLTPWVLTSSKVKFALNNQNNPILRPLSDLTKEIEVDGRKHQMWLLINGCTHCGGTMLKNSNGYTFDIIQLKYTEIQNLLLWHFDIFGLIDAGLAIDINTLN